MKTVIVGPKRWEELIKGCKETMTFTSGDYGRARELDRLEGGNKHMQKFLMNDTSDIREIIWHKTTGVVRYVPGPEKE